MGDKFKNVICKPLKQTTCNNLPNLEIPNTLPGVPDLNPSQAVIDFLNDLLSVLTGINYDEMRMQLINWLVEQLSPLAKDLSLNLKLSLKSCYACKIDPKIPGWLFQTQPGTTGTTTNGGVPGLGYNVEVNKLDLTCLFAANPNSEVGQLFYAGDPLIWEDPINSREIAEFRYYENSPIAFIESSSSVDYQDIEPRPMVINVRIMDSYHEKSLITFINDYFNSQNPLFDVDKVIPNVIDLIYGTLTNKINLPDECLNKVVEFEESVKDYIDNGIDNPEITFDDSFYEFSANKMSNIKNIVQQKKSGVKQFEKCCGKKVSSISYETLDTINKDIKSSPTLQNKIKTYTKAVDTLINESTEGVKNIDKGNASAEFLANFITSLQIALTKIVLSPKNLLLMNMMYFLVNGEPVKGVSIKKILKEYECVIKEIISELIRKLIYEYLLPLVLKALKNLIICYITKKIKEENLQYIKSILSLTPGSKIAAKLEKAKELFGKAQGAADKLSDFTDSVNLNSLNNINLQSATNGRFCD